MTRIDEHRNQRTYPRQFLPMDIDLGNWDQISAAIDKLGQTPHATAGEMERWLLAFSELQAAVAEELTARHIKMTCATDDPELERLYLDYLQNIAPKVETAYTELNRRFMEAEPGRHLDPERYRVYLRAVKAELEIFREENVPLQTRKDILAQKYNKICGEMTVQLDGREQTIPQAMRYLEENDRTVRRQAWTAGAERYLQDREAIETLFDEMLVLRQQMAENAGCDNFIDYQFRKLQRFDYTPADCEAFHDAVEKHVVPLVRRLREQRRHQLGLAVLAPCDLEVDPSGLPPLRPFETADELVSGTDSIFAAVDRSFSDDFHILRDNGLLDLDSRKGKAPGGYQSDLEEARLPFIFMNAAGRNRDVFTLLHEGGHAFHALAARSEPLLAYRHSPIEFCEVASMGMEMMACEKLEAFYNTQNADRARQMHLEDTLVLLPWIARIDAFQHWIYCHPGHTRRQREEKWLELDERLGVPLDWSDCPQWRSANWIRQLHLFCYALYYIEYGIAQLGALQLWIRYREDPAEAVRGYRAALRLGGSRPLPELFATAGLKFDFGPEAVGQLVDKVNAALKQA